jgi:ubiquitin-activating enzyme E1
MLEPPDLAKFGRSEQLHYALFGILGFLQKENRYPGAGDVEATLAIAKETAEANKKEDEGSLGLEEVDQKVMEWAIQFSSCSISPMAAFFGGVIAQEIVKFTGKYTPLKQWLHFDIQETLPRT